MRSALLFVTVAAAVLLLAGPAPLWADSVAASNGTGSSAQRSYPGDTGGWEVYDSGGAGGYQDVYYDPNAGPWLKTLGAVPGGAINGMVYQLTEMLHVGGGPGGTAPGWVDYHETVTTPGWTWSPNDAQHQWGFSAVHDPPWVGVWTYVVPMGNTQVDWTFRPALPVSTNLTLTKWLVFNANAPGANPNVAVVVAEYPTIPEPATMSLLAIGGLGILLRLRKK